MTDGSPYQELMEGLKKETARYRRLVELGEVQRTLLVAGDMAKLPENVRMIEKEVFALGPLSAERAKWIEKLAGSKKATLDTVVKKAPEAVRDELKDCIREVVEAAKKLDEVNRGNEKLIENAVDYVKFTLNALKDGGKSIPAAASMSPKTPGSAAPASTLLDRVI